VGLYENLGQQPDRQKDGLLVSDSPKGEVGIGFPLDALHILLPNLYPEAATQALE
jgi:hypothetical protein